MAMTIKKLIAELEKIDNQSLEVKICILSDDCRVHEIDMVQRIERKMLIFTSHDEHVQSCF